MTFRSLLIAAALLSSVAVAVPSVSAGQSAEPTPVAAATPRVKFLMRLYAPLHAPTQVDDGLIVFQPRDGGYVAGPRVRGEMVPPTGDWVRILPNGNMRIDVRGMLKLADGSMALVVYGGVLKKPSAESWARFLAGEKIEAPEWHYVVAPTFETGSKTYGWLNDIQAVGKFVSIQTGPQAHVAFDIYEVQ